jgi:hypothetical protein
MVTLMMVAACLTAPPVNVERAPPSALAHDLTEAIGALVRGLSVVADDSVSAEEREAVLVALERSGLFELTDSDAAAVLRLSRADDVISAMLESRAGERLWSGQVVWPAVPETPALLLDEATRQMHVLQWNNGRLRIMAAERSYVQAPFTAPQDADFFATSTTGSRPSQMSYAGTPPVTTVPEDWVIVRGVGEVIDDLRLAQLLGDDELARRIEGERFWPQVWWSVGFGAGAIAGATSGALLMRSDDSDTRTVGISLLTAGVVAAALALLSPLLEPDHVLTPSEAEGLMRVHNERLRQTLGLDPEDVRR